MGPFVRIFIKIISCCLMHRRESFLTHNSQSKKTQMVSTVLPQWKRTKQRVKQDILINQNMGVMLPAGWLF